MKAIALVLVAACCAVHAQQPTPTNEAASAVAKARKPMAKPPAPAASGVSAGQIDWSKPVGPPINMKALDDFLATRSDPPKPPRQLGPIDTWRFRRCQEDAAQAPTVVGVHQGMRLCRERFDQ